MPKSKRRRSVISAPEKLDSSQPVEDARPKKRRRRQRRKSGLSLHTPGTATTIETSENSTTDKNLGQLKPNKQPLPDESLLIASGEHSIQQWPSNSSVFRSKGGGRGAIAAMRMQIACNVLTAVLPLVYCPCHILL